MLLSDEEIFECWKNTKFIEDLRHPSARDFHQSVRAAEAAILAKIATKELPEPGLMPLLVIGAKHSSENGGERSFTEAGFYSAACEIFKLGQAQAYAQGAASQLSAEPVAKYIGPCPEGDLVALHDDLKVGEPLYTRREA